ncbi:MAG: hypothetical protein OIF58_01380 [Cohaesibacter sp.]|nr:hypothetical protein [Cohaesibacter sp.]
MSNSPFEFPDKFGNFKKAVKRHKVLSRILRKRCNKKVPRCRPGNRCCRDGCHKCLYLFRKNLCWEFYRQEFHEEGWVSFTIITEHDYIPRGQLHTFDMLAFIGMCSKRIERSPLKSEIIIAGVDLSFNRFKNEDLGYKPHLHGVILSSDKKAVLAGLKEAFGPHELAYRPVVTKVVNPGEWPEPLTYAYKNWFGIRSGYQTKNPKTGKQETSADYNRLPADLNCELWSYLYQYYLGDRMMLRGLRRDPVAERYRPKLRLTTPW